MLNLLSFFSLSLFQIIFFFHFLCLLPHFFAPRCSLSDPLSVAMATSRPQDKRSTIRHEMISPLAEMLIRIQRDAPTNIIYKLKDDRKKLCIALYAYQGRTERELTFEVRGGRFLGGFGRFLG